MAYFSMLNRAREIYKLCRQCKKRTGQIEDWLKCSRKCSLMKELNHLEECLDIPSATSYDELGLNEILDIDELCRGSDAAIRMWYL